MDTESVDRSSISLCDHIRDSVAGVGGDIEHQNIHLVVAFSTGHFAKDPLAANAARYLSSGLVSHLLIQGDQLSVYAWEMSLWPHLRGMKNTHRLDAQDVSKKERLSSLWPLSPESGSIGGHDTENSIVEITERLPSNSNTVVVLITNSAASIGSGNQRVIGQNAPRYLAALMNWHREPQISKSGASITLPFDVINPDGTRLHRSLDAVVLVPRTFSATTLSGRVRPDDAHISASQTVAVKTRRHVEFWPVILVAAMLALFIAWKRGVFDGIMPNNGPLLLIVQGSTFDATSVKEKEEVCHLAGIGYESATDRSVFVTSKDGLPPIKLARFIKDRGGIEIRSDKFSLYSVDGRPFTGSYRMSSGMKCRLSFRGEYSPGPAYPLRQVTAEVDASLDRPASSRRG